MIRIALSEGLAHLDPTKPVASRANVPDVDATLMLLYEDALWVDRAYRRLRPMFFRTEAEARTALEYYAAKQPEAPPDHDPGGAEAD